ncbi:hypothetical protein VTN02DRAFT_4643 [Thermoascus thermophilus]
MSSSASTASTSSSREATPDTIESTSTKSNGPSLGPGPGLGPSFTNFPPVFVFSTHLTLEELHGVEETLAERGAPLTYDVSEARLVLGKVAQKKRAALELRARGLWTEEVPATATTTTTSPGPPAKRRRLSGEQQQHHVTPEKPASEVDREKTHHTPLKHARSRSPASDAGSVASTTTADSSSSSSKQERLIKVVKLEWLDRCLEAGELLPLDPYIVYRARAVPRPERVTTPSSTQSQTAKHILERAREDAASQPPPGSAATTTRFASRRMKEPRDGAAGGSQRQPPRLYRQTTSEHDEAIPLPPVPDWVRDNVMYACMRSAPLHPPNERFVEQLQKIRRTRELTLDEVGVRAYSTSIAAIAAYPYEFRTPAEILRLPGCDMKIANLFAEFRDSPDGTLSAAEALDTDPTLRVLNQFYHIWGVGAKTARDFYHLRGWRDLDDVIEHGWHSLSRVQQIGLKYYDEFQAGIARPEVEHVARTVRRHAQRVRPGSDYDGRGVECVVVGGYRRGKETCGDVDLVLSHRDESVTKNLVVDVVGSLEEEGWVTHTLTLHMTTSHRDQQPVPFGGAADDEDRQHWDALDKALVVWQDPHFEDPPTAKNEEEEELTEEDRLRRRRKRNPNPHRRVDIIIAPWRTVGCAVLGWSGDLTFERDLRRWAKKAHGWRFDSSGVHERRPGGQLVDLERGGETWEARERLVMEGLGVGWRPPGERCSR